MHNIHSYNNASDGLKTPMRDIQKNQYILAFFALCILVTTSLCLGGEYIPNRDIMIAKLNASGIDQWQVNLDTTYDDYQGIIHPLPDGGLLVAGNLMINYGPHCEPGKECEFFNNYVRLVFINQDGTIRKDKIFKVELKHEDINSLYETTDRSFLLTQDIGYIIKLNTTGDVVWNKKPESKISSRIDTLSSLENNKNNYIFIGDGWPGGSYQRQGWFGELTPDGTLIWDQLYPNTTSFRMIAEGPDGGYLLVGESNQLFLMDQSKDLVWNVTLPGEVLAVRTVNGSIEALSPGLEFTVDRNGTLSRITILNIKEPAIWTSDGGFAAATADSQNITLFKMNEKGKEIWRQTVPNRYGGAVQSMVQTGDGGYGILLLAYRQPY